MSNPLTCLVAARAPLLAALLTLANAGIAHAARWDVTGSGSTGLSNAGGWRADPATVTSATDAQGGKSVSVSGSSTASVTAGILGTAQASAMGYASPGLLRALTISNASTAVNPINPSLPNFTGTRASSQISTSFSDRFVITSSTLPIGTDVQYQAVVSMDFSSSGGGGYFGFGWQVGSYDLFLNLPNGFEGLPTQFDTWRHVPLTFNGKVGDAVDVGSTLGVTTTVASGFWGDSYLGDSNVAFIDASHTARMFLDPITPGITLVADSGHNYSISAVPEPATWGLMLGGLGLLVAARRRRALPGSKPALADRF
ncbi:PEP-CTERM sorting domain-containing protein [Roseateles sp.]|uniref:PEP-CTERM sorting domain-containing protein n=1 Tax=Roseateles sp. TaxID=1971397 RepID=UPI003266467C